MRKWNFRRRAKQHKRERKAFVPYEQIQTVVVLFESVGENEDHVYHDIIRQLQQDGKQVRSFAYMEKSKNALYHRENLTILDKKQVNCLHLPEEHILEQVKSISCDVLFDFTLRCVLPLQYVMLYTDAKCRVGIECEKLPSPDFMIGAQPKDLKEGVNEKNDLNFLFGQMLFYLKTIRTTL